MVALIQSENHAANKGKMAGRYQFDTFPTRIGLRQGATVTMLCRQNELVLNPILVGLVSN